MSNYPAFYDRIPPIVTVDPLADVLGASDGGELVYRYEDMVKLAGHSCPTVAGAWLMAAEGLKALYGEAKPVRGEVKVEIKSPKDEGVAGVIGNCIALIVGAGDEGGFKGLGGRMARNNRLFYGVSMPGDVRLSRLDNGQSVQMRYDPSQVPGDASMGPLMQKIMQGMADEQEKRRFGELWQERVEKILLHTPPRQVIAFID